MPKSWKPAVKVFGDPKWNYNGQRFATEAEAKQAADDLMSRWTMVEQAAAHPSDEPVTYAWDGGKAQFIATVTNDETQREIKNFEEEPDARFIVGIGKDLW